MARVSRTSVLRVMTVLAVVLALGAAPVAFAQETTGRLAGTVTMKSDQSALPGVSVEAIHVPTGTRYTALTQANGRYNILNVRVGGPYTITAQISGFRTQSQKDVSVALGEAKQMNFALDLESVTESVVVTADATSLISPDRMGSSAAMPEQQIKVLPTVRRQIQDFARTNPLFNSADYDSSGTVLAVAGKNNRYNTIQIDGAVNNDLFGLSGTGTPGGQADTQPVSLDSIQEIQLVVSPYDVKQGGFTGGGINVITRGGTNEFHGSVYGSTRSEDFVGDKVPQAAGSALDKPISTFDEDQAGFRLGGKILTDKLFFFVSGELNRREQPTGVSADGSTATQFNKPEDAQKFRDILIARYNYDPGSLGDFGAKTDSDLLFGRLDFNVNEFHNATFRHNYVNATRDSVADRSSSRFRFPTAIYAIDDETNSTVLQVNSVFGSSSFNMGRVGYQTIRDQRSTPVNFPTTLIGASTGSPSLLAGTERYSGANSLDQDILEVTDDFTLIKGNHTITIGTHNEFFDFANVYLPDYFGLYRFATVADFDKPNPVAAEYSIRFSNTSNPKAATEFSARQWGLYVGDQWRATDNLSLTFGVRADLPSLPDTPSRNAAVYDTFGIDTSDVPSGDVIISPRLGFNWNPGSSTKHQVRGGVGVFAGRTPFVWISNAYANTGVETTTLTAKNVPFNPDPYTQPKNFPPGTSAISVDGIDPDFEFPRIWRANLAYDRELPFGIRASAEALYSETIRDVYYQNRGKTFTGNYSFDGRPIYKNISSAISDVYYMTNTDEGDQTNLTLQLDKRFDFGLTLNASYAYMDANAAFEGTSSQAVSNWRYYANRGDIFTPEVTTSFWEVEDRFSFMATQSFKTGSLRHNVGLYYNVQSGQPWSVLMYGDPNKDGWQDNDLLYIPASDDAFILQGATYEQWNDFLKWTGLDSQKGEIMERNSLRAPWNRSLDFHYDLELPISVIQTQVTFDVLNVINLIDSDKGLQRYVSNQAFAAPITYSGIDAATQKPIYKVSNANNLRAGYPFYTNDLRSRWQLKLGLRLTY